MKVVERRTRRDFLYASAVAGSGFLIGGCSRATQQRSEHTETAADAQKDENEKGAEVTATEDLMREHGVLRRALLVYRAVADRLRADPASVSPDALQRTAKLFRDFGEDYHEKRLEEAYIFPAVKRQAGPAASYPDILMAQHIRGREITDYILSVIRAPKLAAAADPLSRALQSLVLMYEHHAAREDTIVFPAWKQTLSAKELDEMGDKFEEIERQQFGKDGFEDAAKQIGAIEESLGLADIAQFTAPPPPAQ